MNVSGRGLSIHWKKVPRNLNTNIFDEKEINNIIHNRLPQYPEIHH